MSTITADVRAQDTAAGNTTVSTRVSSEAAQTAALQEPGWRSLNMDLVRFIAGDVAAGKPGIITEREDFGVYLSSPQGQVQAFAAGLYQNLTGKAVAASGGNTAGPLSPSAPTAVDDTANNNALYITRGTVPLTYMGGDPAEVLDVAADAGVQVNDSTVSAGDLLLSGPAGGTKPALGGSTTITTALGGTAILGADGSFSYTPPADVSNEQDTFQYQDWETDPSGQNLVGVSNVATVQIDIEAANPQPFLPIANGGAMLASTSPWPKYHGDTANTGIGLGTRNTTGATTLFAATLPAGVQGSPVVGTGGPMMSTPAVFIEDDTNLVALDATTGATIWTSAATTGPIDSAPANLSSSLVVGTQSGDVLAISPANGTTLGSFTPQESYGGTSNVTGAVKSSPTVVSFTSLPITDNTVVFGTDGTQGYGESDGRVYAVRPDGSVSWEALLAGPIHGSPLVVPPSTGHPNGEVWVETEHNNWGGNPTGLGAIYGRLYELDAVTGQVLAERFVQGEMDGSPALLAGTGGAANQIFATSAYGDVLDVTDTPTAPPSGMESPSPTVLWTTAVGLNPTSAAVSLYGNNIYVGDNNGMNAIPVAGPGTGGGWTVGIDPAGDYVYPVLGAPVVVRNRLTNNPEVIWGSDGSVGQVFSFDDSPAGPVFNWSVKSPPDTGWFFGLSSAAIGPIDPFTTNSQVYIGSTDGTVIDIV